MARAASAYSALYSPHLVVDAKLACCMQEWTQHTKHQGWDWNPSFPLPQTLSEYVHVPSHTSSTCQRKKAVSTPVTEAQVCPRKEGGLGLFLRNRKGLLSGSNFQENARALDCWAASPACRPAKGRWGQGSCWTPHKTRPATLLSPRKTCSHSSEGPGRGSGSCKQWHPFSQLMTLLPCLGSFIIMTPSPIL